MLTITLQLDIDATEKEFFDQIIEDNEGQAIQALGNGRVSQFNKATEEARKNFALGLLASDYTQRFINAQDEKAVRALRQQRQEEREARKDK